jgi:hypothetical protein
VTKSDRQGRLRPDKAQREKDSDITALLRDEKNCDGGFASDMALMKGKVDDFIIKLNLIKFKNLKSFVI